MGRHSEYTDDIGDLICARVAEGKSLKSVCSEPGMPCAAVVYKWLFREKGFIDKYALAREAQSEVYAQDMIDLADECPNDMAAIQKTRLQIDTRKWVAAKLKPKKYGDSTIIRGDKENPIEIGLSLMLDNAAQQRKALSAPDVIDVTPLPLSPDESKDNA